ncbi:uncharacterized protein Dana_GF11149, isoform B [Drosophila ananassae]|uniref:Uncharacterized protein, isoform A n=1 Tax=Drosophila ananassae TaxID=7217 RepID=B3MHG9_DROAN|nr:DNA-binding protein SMUBP-2 [Drosophila ananassae]XP_014762539.1 DNA-binding protein SMUBP-2 [Drosophila ananassae]XP_032306621.1 DNA-binding protein SMUBP-2 [Drosophila ananassae]XP_032306622.1 DNA-binding protein SMUBP-2 [Drosophila ananassae]EDV37969.1 uncharacterized protein Dana_GF11149, isoform A [Drosophila ananassae]KPU77178.1 uncharacterized protein Dana_GF11149, isoform B [Drosophila ananassae]
MTKNKNQKKKAAAAQKTTTNLPDTILTPPANGLVGKTTPQNSPFANGNIRKPPVPWERELIGVFLMNMADQQVITARKEWYVEKEKIRQMFNLFLASLPNGGEVRLKLSVHGAWNIGSLLHRTNFLINTPRGNPNYRIKNFALMEFRKEKFNAIDEKHRESSVIPSVPGAVSEGNKPIIEEYVLDKNSVAMPLKYQKTQVQKPVGDFELNSFGCYICQVNFETIEKYEEHVEYHGDESDFKSLKKMEKLNCPMVTLSYQTCVNSHYFGFTMKTNHKDLVVDKFIIVQLRQFYYVYNARMPLEVSESGELVFFVDSHVFMILREMPIVIGFTSGGKRYVEQHHFMRTEALPKASFNVNPYRLSNNETFKSQGLAPANPPTQVFRALKHEDAQVRLADYDKHYRNYCELGKELTQENLGGTLRTLLQVEDIERLQHYLGLKQTKMELHQFGRELSVKMQLDSNSMSVEDVLSPGDDVLIINERVTQGTAGGVRQMLESNNLVMELALKDFDSIIQWARKVDGQFGQLDKQPRVYFARILGVSTQRVNITCERQLPDNTTYTLIFRPVRAVMRYQYRALQQLALTNSTDVQRILFPGELPPQSKPVGILELNNRLIGSNPEQLQAVRQVALSKKLPAPYIIVGPPGTGKTATICEAIYQLYVRRPETHILVLAGSNTACDEVALRLLRAIAKAPESHPRPLTRIFAASCDRRIDNIDDMLLEYSNMYSLHFYPAVQAVHQYRIVVCTLSLAGKLSTGGFAKGNVFSHVFVDEAAASTEAEALMGITCTISPTTNLILSGDHKQLGPVLQSQRASQWGLSLSLFERLLQRNCYQVKDDGSYNEAVQTRLIRNFRSHPEIVALYSDLYYGGKLKAKAPMDSVCKFRNWFHMPNPDFPIMFHSVFGTVMNTKSSVSLCNNKEIDAVMDYVKDLMYFGLNGEKIAQTDIGIISPYKNQYQRIQEQLNMRSWSQIDCGSVELFQGKEKQVIIVSFVRSFTPKLGFLDNERRLNVLLSRPMSLLILIGNPRTLSQNNDFRRIIELCRDRKTLVGVPYYREENNNGKQNGQCGQSPPKATTGGVRGAVAEQPSTGLVQTLKRTGVQKNPAQAVRFFYNKEELLKLGKEVKVNEKSEMEKFFDELPKVPKCLDDGSQSVRSITKQMKDLKVEHMPKVAPTPVAPPKRVALVTPSVATPAPRVNPVTAAPVSVTTRATAPLAPSRPVPVAVPRTLPRPADNPTLRHTSEMNASSFRRENARYGNGVPFAREVHESSSYQATRPTAYSYVPTGTSRFENSRPLPEEYRRPPPFYENHGSWNNFGRPSSFSPRPATPPPKEKKSTCVIS